MLYSRSYMLLYTQVFTYHESYDSRISIAVSLFNTVLDLGIAFQKMKDLKDYPS